MLFTGDFSFTPSRLIGGLRIPRGTSFDMVVTESTYGTRMHESRAEQERALAEQVARPPAYFLTNVRLACGRSNPSLNPWRAPFMRPPHGCSYLAEPGATCGGDSHRFLFVPSLKQIIAMVSVSCA